MLFTIATARTPATVVPLLKQLQLDLPVVLMNGAVLYDIRNKHYIQTNGFTDDSALRYISVLENRDLIPFVYRIENNKLQVFHKPLVNDIQRDFKYKRENRCSRLWKSGNISQRSFQSSDSPAYNRPNKSVGSRSFWR